MLRASLRVEGSGWGVGVRPASVLSAGGGAGVQMAGGGEARGSLCGSCPGPRDTVLELAVAGLCDPGCAPPDVGRRWSRLALPRPHGLVSLRLAALRCPDPSAPELANVAGLGEGASVTPGRRCHRWQCAVPEAKLTRPAFRRPCCGGESKPTT